MMKVYLTGGSVRDRLMGLHPRDHDYLVTGATHNEMLSLGFLDVGKDHTVYLHPLTKEEYSLSSDLYTDLERRDLTINALAMDGDQVIDYFHGRKDLEQKLLKHIKPENFFHDPLRVYRVARFSSQFPDFSIHPDTVQLMKDVTKTEKFKNIDPERIFSELKKALSNPAPEIFFRILKETGALQVHMTELEKSNLEFLKIISMETTEPVIRFSSLFSFRTYSEVKEFSKRLKLPNEWRDGAHIVVEAALLNDNPSPEEILHFLYKMDLYRRPQELEILKKVIKEKGAVLEHAYDLTKCVTRKDVKEELSGEDIGLAIKEKRLILLKEKIRDKVP